jgi:hypothetical protein
MRLALGSELNQLTADLTRIAAETREVDIRSHSSRRRPALQVISEQEAQGFTWANPRLPINELFKSVIRNVPELTEERPAVLESVAVGRGGDAYIMATLDDEAVKASRWEKSMVFGLGQILGGGELDEVEIGRTPSDITLAFVGCNAVQNTPGVIDALCDEIARHLPLEVRLLPPLQFDPSRLG